MPTKARPSRSLSDKSSSRGRSTNGAAPNARAGAAKTDALGRGEVTNYKSLLQNLDRVVPHALAVVVGTMPRAGLCILQPPDVHEMFARAYDRLFQYEDRLTWATVISGQTLVDCGPDAATFHDSTYYREFMHANGLARVVTAAVADPVFAGYPGALHVYRTDGQGPFTPAQIDAVGALARRIGNLTANLRMRRDREAARQAPPWLHRPEVRQFAFDGNLKSLLWRDSLSSLDKTLAENVLLEAGSRLERAFDGADEQSVALSDSDGERWQFRTATFATYPSLADGPVVFFCMQPNKLDWELVRPVDFEADPEMVKLAAALPYMRSHYTRQPSLNSVAKIVGVSPFHFHRRFTHRMGITPKHYLQECQIFDARRLLAEGRLDLAEVARACGFAHQSHFTSRFKQVMGMTPTRWRKHARQIELAGSIR